MALRYLVLILTDNCNLNCAYCYGKTSARTQPVTMPRDMITESIKWMTPDTPSHIQLTGGEPALVPELIRHTAESCQALRSSVTLGIQTNGTLLTPSLAQMFKKYDIQVGVSLDGPLKIQEQLRGRAADTLKGLALLDACDVPFRITTVVCRENIDYLDKLVLMLGGFANARGIGLDLLIDKGRARGSSRVSPATPDRIKKNIFRMKQALDLVNKNRRFKITLRELETLKKACHTNRPPWFCHAGANQSMAIRPDGTLYPCSQTAGDPDFSMGTLDIPDTALTISLQDFKLSNNECHRCPLDGKCPGDCHSRQYYNTDENRKLVCTLYQTLYE